MARRRYTPIDPTSIFEQAGDHGLLRGRLARHPDFDLAGVFHPNQGLRPELRRVVVGLVGHHELLDVLDPYPTFPTESRLQRLVQRREVWLIDSRQELVRLSSSEAEVAARIDAPDRRLHLV